MTCILSPPIAIIKKRSFYDEKERAYFLEVVYSFGKPDVYGPFDTEQGAIDFL